MKINIIIRLDILFLNNLHIKVVVINKKTNKIYKKIKKKNINIYI